MKLSSFHLSTALWCARIAQSIKRLAMIWTVRGSNPVGGIFRTRSDLPLDPASLLYNGYRVFPVVKRTGRGVDHLPLSKADVKERAEI